MYTSRVIAEAGYHDSPTGDDMNKDRLGAFNDAVLAIVMTIIVLGFEVPDPLTLDALAGMWRDALAYAISFFWLGAMWINQHNFWHRIEVVGKRTLWADLVMLFFSSFFPITTHMVATSFWNPVAQGAYGAVVLLVTAGNVVLYRRLALDNAHVEGIDPHILGSGSRMWSDIVIKLVGMAFTLTVFPPAMALSVVVTLVFLVIPPQLKE